MRFHTSRTTCSPMGSGGHLKKKKKKPATKKHKNRGCQRESNPNDATDNSIQESKIDNWLGSALCDDGGRGGGGVCDELVTHSFLSITAMLVNLVHPWGHVYGTGQIALSSNCYAAVWKDASGCRLHIFLVTGVLWKSMKHFRKAIFMSIVTCI